MERRLLNDFQRNFPLEPEPFRRIAERLGTTEAQVLRLLALFESQGRVSRVGMVFRPNTVGVSTLAALAVHEDDLANVAELVSAFPEVNHNYEREHRYNLWFVVTAPEAEALQDVLRRIQVATGFKPLYLPLEREYHIDLGFDLNSRDEGGGRRDECQAHTVQSESHPSSLIPHPSSLIPHPSDDLLIAAVQDGFPLVSRPYSVIGARAGLSEAQVIERLHHWLESGVARRVGVVVRHHELGYRANAMVVWDVPEQSVDRAGACFARQPFVTLCYRRPRRLPDWPYNLFCMIHGRDRETVLRHVDSLRFDCGIGPVPHQVLFSRQRFKQTGARYAAA